MFSEYGWKEMLELCYVALVKGFGASVGIELRLRVGLLSTIDSKVLIFIFFLYSCSALETEGRGTKG